MGPSGARLTYQDGIGKFILKIDNLDFSPTITLPMAHHTHISIVPLQTSCCGIKIALCLFKHMNTVLFHNILTYFNYWQ